MAMDVEPKIGGVLPQSSHFFLEFSLIFTIHFGGKTTCFWFNTHIPPFLRGCGCKDNFFFVGRRFQTMMGFEFCHLFGVMVWCKDLWLINHPPPVT